MNLFTLVTVAVLVCLAVLAAVSCVRNRKKGCHGGCGSCPYAGSCEKRETE